MRTVLIALGLILLPLQVHATTAASAAESVSPEEMKQRVKYATDYHDVRPIRAVIDGQIDRYARQLPEAEREDFLRYVQLRINYDKIEELSIQAMAETYTSAELKAMVDYYGSPAGKSAEAKSPGYTSKMAPVITQALDSALLDTRFGGKPAP